MNLHRLGRAREPEKSIHISYVYATYPARDSCRSPALHLCMLSKVNSVRRPVTVTSAGGVVMMAKKRRRRRVDGAKPAPAAGTPPPKSAAAASPAAKQEKQAADEDEAEVDGIPLPPMPSELGRGAVMAAQVRKCQYSII